MNVCLARVLALALVMFGSARVEASTLAQHVQTPQNSPRFQVLYRFRGFPDGGNPSSALVADASGALYGIAQNGGKYDAGTVFKLTPSRSGYVETTLYSFAGAPFDLSGSSDACLIVDAAGNVFGTGDGGPALSGGIFELTQTPSGYSETILHSFQGGPNDGGSPRGRILLNAAGVVYGTTAGGGEKGEGAAYSLNPAGSIYTSILLHQFDGGVDGNDPLGGLTAGEKGTFFGTTAGGDFSLGTVFKLTPAGSGYAEKVLYSFAGHPDDGADPRGTLIAERSGALLGTTYGGGKHFGGTVFKLSPSPGGYVESVLYNFQHGVDGKHPAAGLTIGKGGNLFGTTYAGGASGSGTIFVLQPANQQYKEDILHNFAGDDGASPMSDLIADRSGAFYGVASSGGISNCGYYRRDGCGVVFRVRPSLLEERVK